MRLITLSLLVLSSFVILSQSEDDASFIVKPYLQIGYHPSPTSLEILWHTKKDDAIWMVEYNTGSNKNWRKTSAPVASLMSAANLSPELIYRAIFNDLIPGSTFNYRLYKNNKVVFTSTGKAPKSFEQPYRCVVSGDIGAATVDAKKIAKQAFLSNPDLVVVPGDIVYEYGLVSEYRTKFWPVYNADKTDDNGAPLMRSIPFVAAPGNHDVETRDLNKNPDALAYYMFWDQPLNGPLGKEGESLVPNLIASEQNRKAFTDAAGEAYPRMTNFSFDYGNAHWTVLDADNYVDWTDSTIVKWVADDLASASKATWKFVFFHQPCFNSSRQHFEQQQMRALAPVFEAGKVDVVFSGHVHNYQRSYPMRFLPDNKGVELTSAKDNRIKKGRLITGRWTLDKTFNGKTDTHPGGVIYIITGAGGQELYNPEQNNDPDSWQKFTDKFISIVHSFTVADINGKELVIRQLSVDGKELDQFRITKQAEQTSITKALIKKLKTQ